MIHDRTSRKRIPARLSLLALLLVTAGCSGSKPPSDPVDDLRAEIDVQVGDSRRAAEISSAVDEFEAALHDLLEMTGEQQEILASLVADYDSPRGDFDEFFAEYLGKRQPFIDRMLAAHLDLKNLATDEEWERLTKEVHAIVAGVARQTLK